MKVLRGFSLMELMITLAVAAILLMVAIPSYMNYVMKSRRSDAKTSILEISQLEENFRGDNNKYSDNIQELCRSFQCNDNYKKSFSKEGFYTLVLTATPTTTFTITATPAADKAQVGDTMCAEFSVNQLGQRAAKNSSTSDSTSECW